MNQTEQHPHTKLRSDVEEMLKSNTSRKSRAESVNLPQLLVLRASSPKMETDNVGDDAFESDKLYIDTMRIKKENELKVISSSSSSSKQEPVKVSNNDNTGMPAVFSTMDPDLMQSKLIPTTADSVFQKIGGGRDGYADSILKKYDRKELGVIEE